VVDESLNVSLSPAPISLKKISIEESQEGRTAICDFFRRQAAVKVLSPDHSSRQTDAVKAAAGIRRPLWRRLVRRVLPEALVIWIWRLRHRLGARTKFVPQAGVRPSASLQDTHVSLRYWGLQELDRQIEKYLDFDRGYFVELGANDGRFQSNTLYYEQTRGWRGVLVEPAPKLYQQCRENRSPADFIVNAACVSFTYPNETVQLIYSNAMSVALHVESDLGDPGAHAELGRQFLRPEETVFNFQAPARTLNSILFEADAPRRIDFLSLDVEGAEIEVLKGVDHKTFRFRYMLIECRDIDRLNEYLKAADYSLLEKFNEHDYLFADAALTPA
jgi:FkbM family methyltransferase